MTTQPDPESKPPAAAQLDRVGRARFMCLQAAAAARMAHEDALNGSLLPGQSMFEVAKRRRDTEAALVAASIEEITAVVAATREAQELDLLRQRPKEKDNDAPDD